MQKFENKQCFFLTFNVMFVGSKECWTATTSSTVCSQYKSCYQRCMTNETCPDECNISMMLGMFLRLVEVGLFFGQNISKH